ncbi:hypothetical protein B5F40_02620 [Gordonibacter sp. An230]|uniref:hypothetical protein n=1 Tax=Gordonibacter sp. An230 TaxID=1965592 RepID=UPI000B375D0B|nr:hypothetical protein [Gordonibacter sp. An230]OUO91749.1 hypothetical protein B5F40_02620 [Gordonibacter sp. An230]
MAILTEFDQFADSFRPLTDEKPMHKMHFAPFWTLLCARGAVLSKAEQAPTAEPVRVGERIAAPFGGGLADAWRRREKATG